MDILSIPSLPALLVFNSWYSPACIMNPHTHSYIQQVKSPLKLHLTLHTYLPDMDKHSQLNNFEYNHQHSAEFSFNNEILFYYTVIL